MALALGWKPKDARLSYYWQDPAVDWEATPEPSRAAYFSDGDASHLVLRDGIAPTKIQFRALDAEERATIHGICQDIPRKQEGESKEQWDDRWVREFGVNATRLWYWSCAAGVSLPDEPSAKRELGRGGLRVLPKAIMRALEAAYGDDFYLLYGRLVWQASQLGEDEKKASSLPSGQTVSPSATTAPISSDPCAAAPTSGSTSNGRAPSEQATAG
jgi:hypothetical protein